MRRRCRARGCRVSADGRAPPAQQDGPLPGHHHEPDAATARKKRRAAPPLLAAAPRNVAISGRPAGRGAARHREVVHRSATSAERAPHQQVMPRVVGAGAE